MDDDFPHNADPNCNADPDCERNMPTASAAPSPSPTDQKPDPPLQPWHCKAKNRSGKPCRRPAMRNGRCNLHGGKSLSGLAAPAFKHGRYSKSLAASLPSHLRQRFEEALADSELLSIRAYVALYDVKILDAVEKLYKSDAGDFRQRLLDRWRLLEAVNAEPLDPSDQDARAKRAAKVSALLSEIGQVIHKGAAEAEAWETVDVAIRKRAKLSSQESRRLVTLKQMLSVEQAVALIVLLYDSLKRHIADPKILAAIGDDIDRVTNKIGGSDLSPPAIDVTVPVKSSFSESPDHAEHT